MTKKKHTYKAPEQFWSIQEYILGLSKGKAEEVLDACLRRNHPGFPIGSPHGGHDAEDIFWRTYSYEDVSPDLVKMANDVLRPHLGPAYIALSASGEVVDDEDLVPELVVARRALILIQRCSPGGLEKDVENLVRLLFLNGAPVELPIFTRHALSALREYGANRSRKDIWKMALEYDHLAAVAFNGLWDLKDSQLLEDYVELFCRSDVKKRERRFRYFADKLRELYDADTLRTKWLRLDGSLRKKALQAGFKDFLTEVEAINSVRGGSSEQDPLTALAARLARRFRNQKAAPSFSPSRTPLNPGSRLSDNETELWIDGTHSTPINNDPYGGWGEESDGWRPLTGAGGLGNSAR